MSHSSLSTRVRAIPASDRNLALLAGLVALALYLLTLSPSMVVDDGGELQMLAYRQGIPHPTGYPLFLLLAGLFARLPLPGDVALQVTLLSTLASALSISLLYLLAREVGAGRLPALAAALLLATAPRLWMHATATEVYGLANVFMLLCSWLLLRWGRGRAPLWLVTLAFGFGLTHHIFLRLFGPAAAVYVLLVEPRLLLRPRRWLPALLALLLPLALYAYLPLRAQAILAQPQWAGTVLGVRKVVAAGLITPHYFAGLDNLVLALDYSSEFFSSAALGLNILGQYVEMTLQQVPLAAVLVALAGVVALFRRRWRASVFLALAYGVTLLAALKFLAEVGEDGDNFIPLYLLMAPCFALGAETLLAGARRLYHASWPQWLLVSLILVLPAYNFAAHLPGALERRQTAVRAQAQALLERPLPAGAVILGDWRDVTPLRYLQRVENVRPDLWIIHSDAAGIRLLLQRALAANQPLYVLRPTAAGLKLWPAPSVDTSPTIPYAGPRRLNAAVRWLGYDLSPTVARPGETLSLTFYWAVDNPPPFDWSTFVHLLDAEGEKVAQVDRVPVGDIYPPTHWQPGQTIVDPYELTLPPDLPPGAYTLIFGAYSGEQRFTWENGESTQFLAEIEVKS